VTSAFFSDVSSGYVMTAILSSVGTSALIYHFIRHTRWHHKR